ncbi:MAG: hypothetical protein ACI9TV_003075 [Sulfurimonas sp.]|jgi:hypothetical protein
MVTKNIDKNFLASFLNTKIPLSSFAFSLIFLTAINFLTFKLTNLDTHLKHNSCTVSAKSSFTMG